MKSFFALISGYFSGLMLIDLGNMDLSSYQTGILIICTIICMRILMVED